MKIKNCDYCRKTFIALIALLIIAAFFTFLPRTIFAATKISYPSLSPFGGPVLVILPCIIPPNCLYLEVGPPVGGKLYYLYGVSFSYLFGPPSHVGQWLLGFKGEIKQVCIARKKDDCKGNAWRKAALIIPFHGSSL